MGNVLALTPPPLPSLVPAPPPTLPASDDQQSKASESKEPEDTLNPGTIEDLHKKCKDIFPVNFEGARLMVNKGLSNHFQISHTLNMSTFSPAGYRFGATYVGTKQFGPQESYPVLLGDIDPSGNMNANVIHQFTKNFRTKFAAQFQDSRCMASQFTADLKGDDYTASLTVGNLDIVNSSGVAMLHYLQSMTGKLALGTELAYQFGPQVPGGEIAVLSLSGRYSGPSYTVSATLNPGNAHVCYYHKNSENLQMGVEVETNLRLGESVSSVGYQIDLPKANLVFRGMVDSNWTVGAVLEKKLPPLPFTFALSGMMNYAKNQSRFGFGLFIG